MFMDVSEDTNNSVSSGQTISMASTSSTFTNSEAEEENINAPDTQPTTYSQELTNEYHTQEFSAKASSQVWGKLLPASNIFKFKPVDLVRDHYTFGRHGCDIPVTVKEMGEGNLINISKLHFSITRRHTVSGPVIELENHSLNGTFLNNFRVEKGSKKVLTNQMTIAPALLTCTAYIFMDLSLSDLYPDSVTRKYTVLNQIGSGAFGDVYKAVRNSDHMFMAIKVINKSSNPPVSEFEIKQLDREIRISQQVNNYHTVKILDVIDTPKAVYLVLELMNGGEFSGYLRENLRPRLSEEVAKFYFLQMALGVSYLHEMGIVHRDIKPENMLLESADALTTLKISDFGLSKLIHSSQLKTFVGSPLYVSPEVLTGGGHREYGPKIDCWSLGVILYTMLTGRMPFINSRHDLPVSVQITTGRVRYNEKVWQNISGQAKDLVKRLLEVNPQSRLSIQEVLDHGWLQDETVKQKVADLYVANEASKRPLGDFNANSEYEHEVKRPKFE